MIFPIQHLMDEQKCYGWLLDFFHDGKLPCPSCGGHHYHGHQYARSPVVQYLCDECGTYFNIFTSTEFKAAKWPCSRVVTVLRGFLKGESTNSIAKEQGLSYCNLLYLRHRLMENAHFRREAARLPDGVTESDEVFQNAGEKGIPHTDPDDPPRCRANKKKGLGTFENDRPPVYGTVGRESGQVRLEVLHNATQAEVGESLGWHRSGSGTCYSDESGAYNRVATERMHHATVCHSAKEWARDDDGDGINEVHVNTAEGLWTEFRNFMRRFKGVSKHYIHLYVAMFEWMHNLKKVTPQLVQIMVNST